MDNIDIMRIQNVNVNATGSIGRHRHFEEGVLEVHYFLDGVGTFINAGVPYVIRPGTFFCSMPRDFHQSDEARGGGKMVVYSLSFLLDTPADEPMRTLLETQFVPRAELFIGKGYGLLFEDFRRKLGGTDPLIRLSAHHRFLAFLYEILGGHVKEHQPRGQQYVDEALLVMQSSITSSLEIDELAQHLGIDKSYFIRLFKQVVGIPPLRYYVHLKMDAARSSLADDNKSVGQVARDLGYEDQFYFSRVFKSVTGLAPQAWRDQYLNARQ